jgi:hypothetical protein
MAQVTVPAVVPDVEIVWTGIVEVPLAVKPETPAVAVAVQTKVVPVTLDISVTKVVFEPDVIVCVNGEFVTIGVAGCALMVTIVPAELQPPAFCAVTV